MTREELIVEIRNADEHDGETFQKIISRVLRNGWIQEKLLAEMTGASYPTILSWRNGEYAPLLAKRKRIYRWLIEQISTQKR